MWHDLELSLEKIAGLIKGTVNGNGACIISGMNSLDKAKEGDISFFYDARYKEQALSTKASALIVSENLEGYTGDQILVANPKLAYAKLAAMFAPRAPQYEG